METGRFVGQVRDKVANTVEFGATKLIDKAQTYAQRLQERCAIPDNWKMPAAIFGGIGSGFAGFWVLALASANPEQSLHKNAAAASVVLISTGAFCFGRVYESISVSLGKGLESQKTKQEPEVKMPVPDLWVAQARLPEPEIPTPEEVSRYSIT